MLPAGLSMLWEPVEAEAALRQRFGFEGFLAVTDWVTAVLDREWRFRVRECPRMVISGRNAIVWATGEQGNLVVKWSGVPWLFASLDASTRLLRGLADQGLPVASPFATASGRDRVVLDGPAGGLSVAVLPELTGDWLDVSDLAAVHAAGACLARVHLALGAGSHDAFWKTADSRSLEERIEAWLREGDRGLAPEASRRLAALLGAMPELADDRQLVHNDFRAANILTRASTVTAVLDFDDVRVDHPVVDVAKASVYLSTRFTDWQPTPPLVRQALGAGYESVRAFSSAEAHWLEVLVLWLGIQAVPAGNDPARWAAAL
jgi:Ser/Thr protein kinase RdoA (MazF antagonist)